MTDRLTPEREAEIAARAAAATKGPWGSHRDLNGAYTIQARPRTTRYGMESDGDIVTLAADRTDAESYANARFIAHAREDVPALLAELAAVRAERDAYRERALDAENRSVIDGCEVCADCERPVPDGPCGGHSPDAVFQRTARDAAQLRAERNAAWARADRYEERLETLRALCDAAEHIGLVSGGWFTVEAIRRATDGEPLPTPSVPANLDGAS